MAMTSPNPSGPNPTGRLSDPMSETVGQGWSIAVGVLLLLAGVAAIVFPFISSLAVTIFLGWLLAISGVIQIVHAFASSRKEGAVWQGLVGLIFLIGGVLVVLDPLAGVLTLTMLIAAIFLAEGAIEIFAAFRLRHRRHWGWLLLSGVVALIAGLVIALQLPGSAIWVIGFIAGINLIFSGIGFLMDREASTLRA